MAFILPSLCFFYNYFHWGGQDRVAVKRLHCNDKDVGSNPTATIQKRKLNIMRSSAQKVP